jgi:hypothetical protein
MSSASGSAMAEDKSNCEIGGAAVAETLPEVASMMEEVENRFVAEIEAAKNSGSGHDKVVPKDKIEADLKKAADGGVVDLRSALGQRFTLDVKKSTQMKDDYTKCMGHAAKASFRASWASDAWKVIADERLEQTKQTYAEFSNGVYRPVSVIFKKEGGDAAALEGTKAMLGKCMALGHPFIRISPWTNRLELLHITSGLEHRFEQMWMQVTRSENAAVVDKGAKRLLDGAVGDKDVSGAEADKTERGAETPQARRKQPKLEAVTGEKEKPAKKESSTPTGGMTAAQSLMRVMKGAEKQKASIKSAAHASDIVSLINTDSSWSWARNEQNLGSLESLILQLSQSKNEFVKTWLVTDIASLKSMYKQEVIEAELNTVVPKVAAIASTVSEKVAQLNAMRRAFVK